MDHKSEPERNLHRAERFAMAVENCYPEVLSQVKSYQEFRTHLKQQEKSLLVRATSAVRSGSPHPPPITAHQSPQPRRYRQWVGRTSCEKLAHSYFYIETRLDQVLEPQLRPSSAVPETHAEMHSQAFRLAEIQALVPVVCKTLRNFRIAMRVENRDGEEGDVFRTLLLCRELIKECVEEVTIYLTYYLARYNIPGMLEE